METKQEPQEKTCLNLQPAPLNLLAPLRVPLNISGREITQLCAQRARATSDTDWQPVFDERAPPPAPPPKPNERIDASNVSAIVFRRTIHAFLYR